MSFDQLNVIETGGGIAGPLVGRALRDLGANVVKLESRRRLDFGRTRVPPPGKTSEHVHASPSVHDLHAGKASVTVNLKTELGRTIFVDMTSKADVYVDTYAPGWLERIGLSYESFQERNPQLIILSQSAYGTMGPKRDQRAYAPIMTALAGLESTVGYQDGRTVSQVSSAVGDLVAGHFGILLVLSALYSRQSTSRGTILDMSQIEASVAIAGIAFAEYGLTGETPGPRGNAHPMHVPHGLYRVAGDDQWVSLAICSDDDWSSLCDSLGLSEAVRCEYQSTELRLQARDEIDQLVTKAFASWSRDEVVEALQAAGIPCTPVLSIYEADRFAPLVDRGLWEDVQHPSIESLRLTGIPWRFDSLEAQCRGWADGVGASTDHILRQWLGATDQQLESWHAAGALE